MILSGDHVSLRPGVASDVERLLSILREPEVAAWWGAVSEDELRQKFVGNPSAFVIEVDGEAIGMVQYSEEDNPIYRHAGVDIFISASRQRRGFGTDALRTVARYLFDARGHHRLSIDPAIDNGAAIGAYEKVGFRRVGVMRAYERGPDGTWHDGLLMDLLVGELVER